ncbi:hypothetical protein [Devosia sp. A369]
MTDECHVFRPGEPVQVASAPFQIGEGGDVFGLPGPVPADAWAVLDYVVGIVHRIVPWAVVHAAPIVVIEFPPDDYPCREIIKRKDNGKDYVKIGGISFEKEGLVALSLASSAVFLIETAYHESWHQLEKIIDKNILDEIDSLLVSVRWGSAYLDSMVEHRARCFQTWAMHFEEGMPDFRLSGRIDEIFDAAAAGEIAEKWMSRQKKAGRAAR